MSEHGALPARGEHDEQVHALDAGRETYLNPAFQRTRCGVRVVEVFNDRREVTCTACGQR